MTATKRMVNLDAFASGEFVREGYRKVPWFRLALRSMVPPKAACATITILGLLVCSRGAYSRTGGPGGRPQFESASVTVPTGSTCALHPEGDMDPKQTITIRADADGVARFLAVRPTLAGSVDKLALDCTDSGGNANTYSVDLRSDETFASRPFDASRAGLTFRPALTGDPLRYTPQELIKGGFGVRPDPTANPDGYRRWLAAVSVPAYKLRSSARTSPTARSARQLAAVASEATSRPDPQPSVRGSVLEPAAVYAQASNYWTGAILSGSYQKNATSALTYSYVLNEASFVVPTLTPGGFGTAATQMTMWTGLDNVFQAIVDVDTTPTTGWFGIHRQNFYHHDGKQIDEEGTLFTPHSGDTIFAEEWYCAPDGLVQMAGGYGCSIMMNTPANPSDPAVEWECVLASSSLSDCQSYTIDFVDLANGALGQQAEFIYRR